MAAAITTTATSLEGQLYECALALVSAELALPIETRPDNAQVTFDVDNGTIAVAVSLASTMTVVSGQARFAAIPYLV